MFQGNTTFNTDEIDIHIRTYRSLLKSAGEVKIEKLVDSHISINSILHEKAGHAKPDMSAFIYVLLRLPNCMSNIKKIILGQSSSVFANNGYEKISHWQDVKAPGRRRKMYYDGKSALAVYISSVTDVDDVITLLTAFQIEWNKLHKHLSIASDPESTITRILDRDDIERVKNIWGKDYPFFLQALKQKEIDFTVKLLEGSYVEYAKATQHWWENIARKLHTLGLNKRPVYFISSNTHSIANLLTRFAASAEKKLIDYLYSSRNDTLIRLWEEINAGDFLANKENFLYYIAKKYAVNHPEFLKQKGIKEKQAGIHYIPASHYLDIDTQIIELKKLVTSSPAVIINIDYPLGWAAYQILTEIGQNVEKVRGIYIMGKAATLNGQIGDIILPSTIFDQHTKNVYAVNNILKTTDFTAIFKTGAVLDKQKTVSTKGTFLENKKLIEAWYKEGYTTIEMEAGPYLNAAYEFVYYNRYVENQFINLTDTPFEFGIAHYASDTPYSKAKNLGVRNLSYEGIEPTYAISFAILRKIIEKEKSL